MHWFYLEEIKGNEPVLDKGESHHAARVLRLQNGDRIMISDGKGRLCTAEIAGIDPGGTLVKLIESKHYQPRSPGIHIAIAPPKAIDRMEWFVEKATECGVEQITPVLCSRSERKSVNTERLKKIAVSAMKQSKQPWVPVINDMTRLDDLVGKTEGQGRYLAHTGSEIPGPFLGKILVPGVPAMVLIGPEGDFSPDEVSLALGSGFQAVNLGKSILRTETAGVFAAHTVRVVNELSVG